MICQAGDARKGEEAEIDWIFLRPCSKARLDALIRQRFHVSALATTTGHRGLWEVSRAGEAELADVFIDRVIQETQRRLISISGPPQRGSPQVRSPRSGKSSGWRGKG